MGFLAIPIQTHKKFIVYLDVRFEDKLNYYRDSVTTEVVIPNGRPMVELLAQTIFKCLEQWSSYDNTIKEAFIEVYHYKRLCDETVVGFVNLERRRSYSSKEW